MPNQAISQLTPAGALTGAEIVPIVQSGTTVRTTINAINNQVLAYGSFFNSASQTLAAGENAISHSSAQTFNSGITLNADRLGFTVTNGGFYTLTANINVTGSGIDNTLRIYPKVNSATSSFSSIAFLSSGSNSNPTSFDVNFLLSCSSGATVQLFATGSNTLLFAGAASGIVPAIPSITTYIHRVG